MGVEYGPQPNRIPWRVCDAVVVDRDGWQAAAPTAFEDAAAICHRVNNWDQLIAERDALAARVKELEGDVKKLHMLTCG